MTVEKQVIGNASSKDDEFDFEVQLTRALTGTYGDMTFDEGVAMFTLKTDGIAIAAGLPEDTEYTVTEKDAKGYTTTVTDGTVSSDPTNAVFGEIKTSDSPENGNTVIFTNAKWSGGLKVTKTVTGAVGKAENSNGKKFKFTVTLSDETISGKYGGMDFDTGKANFELGDGESLTAEKLPATSNTR